MWVESLMTPLGREPRSVGGGGGHWLLQSFWIQPPSPDSGPCSAPSSLADTLPNPAGAFQTVLGCRMAQPQEQAGTLQHSHTACFQAPTQALSSSSAFSAPSSLPTQLAERTHLAPGAG